MFLGGWRPSEVKPHAIYEGYGVMFEIRTLFTEVFGAGGLAGAPLQCVMCNHASCDTRFSKHAAVELVAAGTAGATPRLRGKR